MSDDSKTTDQRDAANLLSSEVSQQAKDFVLLEYEQCIGLIKYYDERQADLVKFVSALSAGVPSVFFAFAKLGDETTAYLSLFATIVSMFTSLGIFSIFAALVQTRAYFTYAARQANSIRAVMTKGDTYFVNRLWINPDRSAFDWHSAHTVQFVVVCIQRGLFAGIGSFAAVVQQTTVLNAGILAMVVIVLATILGVIVARSYLTHLPVRADIPTEPNEPRPA